MDWYTYIYFLVSVCILFLAVGLWNVHLPSTSWRHVQILTDGWKWPRLQGGDTSLCLLRELVRPLTRVLLPAAGFICPRARRLPASLTRPPWRVSRHHLPLTPDELEHWTLRLNLISIWTTRVANAINSVSPKRGSPAGNTRPLLSVKHAQWQHSHTPHSSNLMVWWMWWLGLNISVQEKKSLKEDENERT